MFPGPFKTIFAFVLPPPQIAQADCAPRRSADIFLANGAVYPDDHSKPRAAVVYGKKLGNFGNDARRTLVPVSVNAPGSWAVRPEIALM